MLHSRHEEELIPRIQLDALWHQGLVYLLVKELRGSRWNKTVRLSVVVKKLAASRMERTDIEIASGSITWLNCVCELDDTIIEIVEVPVFDSEEVSNIIDSKTVGLVTSDQDVPLRFTSDLEVWEDERLCTASALVLLIVRSSIDAFASIS